MQNVFSIFQIVLIALVFCSCKKTTDNSNSEIQEDSLINKVCEESAESYVFESYPKDRTDSLNAIFPQETHLFQLFKKGFKKFRLPIQKFDGVGYFPEIFEGFLQRLMNPIDSLRYNLENDTIFWCNEYVSTGDTYTDLTSTGDNVNCMFTVPYKSIHWIKNTKISSLEDLKNIMGGDMYYPLYELLKLNNRDSLRRELEYWKNDVFPGRSMFLGMIIYKDNQIVKIDTAHYGTLPPSHKGGENGSFFEIPDSIFELYCKKPQ